MNSLRAYFFIVLGIFLLGLAIFVFFSLFLFLLPFIVIGTLVVSIIGYFAGKKQNAVSASRPYYSQEEQFSTNNPFEANNLDSSTHNDDDDIIDVKAEEIKDK